MSKAVKYGIGAVIVAGAVGGGAIWYMNGSAENIAGDLLEDAKQFVAENMDGATLSYGDYTASGLARSVTVSDVNISHEDGSAITMDSITISGNTNMISITNASNISLKERGQVIGQITALDELTIDNVTRDGGLITSANVNVEGLKIGLNEVVGADMAPMLMMIGINEVVIDGSTSYEISLAKGTVSGSFGLGINGLGMIDMSAALAGLTKDKYQDMLANAAYFDAEDYIEDYGLGLDSFSIDYKDDSLADTLLDMYGGGNRANLAQEVSGMIMFYGMMSQQADLANALAPAVSNFIKGGNSFSFSMKAKQTLTEDVIMQAIQNGTLKDIVSISASGS